MTSNMLGKKAIAVWFAIAAMIGAGAFAIVPTVPRECINQDECDFPAVVNDPNQRAPLLLGDSIDSSGTVATTNTFQWEEDCVITETGAGTVFDEVLTQCMQHTVVIRLLADEGDRAIYSVEDLRCFAEDDDRLARVTANVDSGLLVDVVDSSDVTDIRITNVPNQWIVTVSDCDSDLGDPNEFDFELLVLDEGDFRFSLSIEPV